MFKLPQEIKSDIDKYRSSLEELKKGKISSARFKGIRVPWGIYSHRGGKVFMARIRVPAGIVSSEQLKALAKCSKKYGNGLLHITTRQDIQLHDVRIEDTINVMERLKEFNLSPRGGGGNTVRNVIACSCAGICKDELFDVRSYALALTEHLLRQESSYQLPRKFKIAFAGCPKDCAGVLVNDVGFLAKKKDSIEGFGVFVGGGMGAHSRVGRPLEEFIALEDIGYVVTAVKNIFYKKGDRRNRHHNRLRFLIEDMGFDVFKELYKKELAELKEKEYIALRRIEFPHPEEKESALSADGDASYRAFIDHNVHAQKQSGFQMVTLRIPRGDIKADSLTALAGLNKDFPGIEFRTSQKQNIIICWVQNKDLLSLYTKLKKILSDFLYPDTLLDVVACKGALTCNLGLCNSPGLSAEIEKIIKKEFLDTKMLNTLEIKMNGCPNACGQQPIGKISFYGVVKRVDNRLVPFYNFLLGGRKEAERTKLAEAIGALPARNVVQFLSAFLNALQESLKETDNIYEVLDGPARDIAKRVIADYAYVPPYDEDKSFYMDWGKTDEFSLSGLGTGECGAGVLDMIDSDLTDAKLSLEEAERNGYAAQEIQKTLHLAARALLVVKGEEPKSAALTFTAFYNIFIKENIAPDTYGDIAGVYNSVNERLTVDARKKAFLYAQNFLAHINKLYHAMDSTFNFPKKENVQQEEAAPARSIDLKGTPCPINYVKTKLVLETLASGSVLEVLLDDGEPIENVPRSLKNDGHRILKMERVNEFWKVVVKKK